MVSAHGSQAIPQQVRQRQLVHAAAREPRSLEDALRELLRESPYLVVSALVHALLLAAFATSAAAPPEARVPVIISGREIPAELLPVVPPVVPRTLDEDRTRLEEPVVIEDAPDDGADDPLASVEPAGGAGGDRGGSQDVIGAGFGGLVEGRGGGSGSGIGHRGPPDARVRGPVADALDWLAAHQARDGHWSCAGFDEQCGTLGSDTICDGTGNPAFDVGVSSLALLAFLGAGQTDRRGEHAATVRDGLRFLVNVQQPDGNFGSPDAAQSTYDHVLATLALVEAWSLSGNAVRFRAPAERGLAHLASLRNPGAGWRYRRFHPEMTTTPNDMSVTGWAILTLTMAKKYGLRIDERALEDALGFLDEMTDPATGITGYATRGGRPAREASAEATWPAAQSESMTAVGVLCRIFADPSLSRPGARELVERGVRAIAALPPVWSDELPGRRDFYFWYYGSYALFQAGGEPWKAWERALLPAIAGHQQREGERRGSWDPQPDPWGGAGGRVYSTAILALTLEVFSRYDTVLGAH
jgi:hypothetical protein